MSVAIQISIQDDASGFVKDAVVTYGPRRVNAAIGPPVKDLITDNYRRQPPNRQGFPSTGFWSDAIRATRLELPADGPLIVTEKIGVRQRYFGGTIRAGAGISSFTGQPTKYIIAYAASPEVYGKNPSVISAQPDATLVSPAPNSIASLTSK